MTQEIKLIRKQFRITRQEEKQIKEMMKEQRLDSFSDFLRQNLFKKDYTNDFLSSWFSLWQYTSLIFLGVFASSGIVVTIPKKSYRQPTKTFQF